MDTLSRIVRTAIARGFGWRIGAALAAGLIAFLLHSGDAKAAGTVPATGTMQAFYVPGPDLGVFATPQAACTAFASYYQSTLSPRTVDAANFVNNACKIDFTLTASCCGGVPAGTKDSSYYGVSADATMPSCPANSTATAGGCTCSSGFNASGGSCVAAISCSTIAAAENAIGATLVGGVYKSLLFCDGGCVLEASNGYGTSAPGEWALTGTFTATGATCSGAPGSGTTSDVYPKPEPLPAGKCPGTVNGTPVVVSCGTTVTKETTAATQVDTTASGVSSTGTATNSSKTVTCEGGNCTTTTTTTKTNPDGSSGTSTEKKTEPKPQDSFCKENPNLRICKESSAASSCAGGTASTQCDGDAVQCLLVREQLRRQCEFFDKATPQTATGNAAIAAGTGGASDHPFKSPVTTSLATFDSTDLVPGSCPADRVLMIGAARVVLPYSKVCAPASQLGSLLVGLTALACVAIVFKGA